MCKKASLNPRYRPNEAELVEAILLKYATSLTDDYFDSDHEEEEVKDSDGSLEYKTVIEDYFRAKNLNEDEKEELWDFINRWSYEAVPTIIWNSDLRRGSRLNRKRVSLSTDGFQSNSELTKADRCQTTPRRLRSNCCG